MDACLTPQIAMFIHNIQITHQQATSTTIHLGLQANATCYFYQYFRRAELFLGFLVLSRQVSSISIPHDSSEERRTNSLTSSI